MDRVKEDADARVAALERALSSVFHRFMEKREVEVVVFSSMSAKDLAGAISAQPIILKPLMAACNIAARAVERDLGIKNLNTYRPRITLGQASLIAGYIKPFLPAYLALPTLIEIDRLYYIDKEIRKNKGRWEHRILDALNRYSESPFHKTTFEWEGETFELDAATKKNELVEIGIDVKRIEARRDIHKRADEIVNKANKFKAAFPKGRFGVVMYYPFIDEQVNVQNRLRSTSIDCVVFASESDASIESSVRLLLSTLTMKK